MAGYVIHLAIGEEYLRKHKEDIRDEVEFLKGIVAPDETNNGIKAHYGEKNLIESLYNFLKSNKKNLNKDYFKGYFLHLLTDYMFYGKYFEKRHYYDDYDRTNKTIIEKYNVRVPNKLKEYAKFADGEPKYLRYNLLYEIIDLMTKETIEENIEKLLKGEY